MKPRRRPPKLIGEWVECEFQAAATHHGLVVSKPYGDSAPFDFVLGGSQPLHRVQVRGTSHLTNGRCYVCRITHGYPPLRYSADEIDFMAIFVIPYRAWYIRTSPAPTDASSASATPGGSSAPPARASFAHSSLAGNKNLKETVTPSVARAAGGVEGQRFSILFLKWGNNFLSFARLESPSKKMIKAIVISSFIVGALMPLFWTFLALAMMHARGFDWLDYPIMITTPWWLCGWSYKGDLRIMPLNGLLYAAVVFAVVKLTRKIRQPR
jgi:hypothetical protein